MTSLLLLQLADVWQYRQANSRLGLTMLPLLQGYCVAAPPAPILLVYWVLETEKYPGKLFEFKDILKEGWP